MNKENMLFEDMLDQVLGHALATQPARPEQEFLIARLKRDGWLGLTDAQRFDLTKSADGLHALSIARDEFSSSIEDVTEESVQVLAAASTPKMKVEEEILHTKNLEVTRTSFESYDVIKVKITNDAYKGRNMLITITDFEGQVLVSDQTYGHDEIVKTVYDYEGTYNQLFTVREIRFVK